MASWLTRAPMMTYITGWATQGIQATSTTDRQAEAWIPSTVRAALIALCMFAHAPRHASPTHLQYVSSADSARPQRKTASAVVAAAATIQPGDVHAYQNEPLRAAEITISATAATIAAKAASSQFRTGVRSHMLPSLCWAVRGMTRPPVRCRTPERAIAGARNRSSRRRTEPSNRVLTNATGEGG